MKNQGQKDLIGLTIDDLESLIKRAVYAGIQEYSLNTGGFKIRNDTRSYSPKETLDSLYWRPKTCALALNMSISTFWKKVASGELPPHSRQIGKFKLWKKEDLISFVEKNS